MDALFLDFVNSEFRDFRGRWVRDDLEHFEWRDAFLLKWGLHVETPFDATIRKELVALRTLLTHCIESVTEGQIEEQDQVALNAILFKAPLRRQLRQGTQALRLEMAPIVKNWDWVQAEIVASFIHVLAFQDARRLKRCANPQCRWVFYDESKSRTKRYCSTNLCANLLKVRRFRAHHISALSSE